MDHNAPDRCSVPGGAVVSRLSSDCGRAQLVIALPVHLLQGVIGRSSSSLCIPGEGGAQSHRQLRTQRRRL